MSLSLDGNNGANTSTTSVSATLTTTKSNNLIMAVALVNSSSPVISDNLNGGTGLTWNSRASSFDGVAAWVISWWAVASTPLTSGSITVTNSNAAFKTLMVFGVNGANISSPFDGTPVTGSGSPSLTISTSNSNSFVFYTGDQSQSPQATFSQIDSTANTNFLFNEYAIFSTPQSGLVVTAGAGNNVNPGYADAIIQLSTSVNLMSQICM